MKNKIVWLLIAVFMVASIGGYFTGRYIAIRRSLSTIAEKLPDKVRIEEIKRYREEMEKLKELRENQRKKIIIEVKRGNIEEMKDQIDSISKISSEILKKSMEQIHEISRNLPPDMRDVYIRKKLKIPEIKKIKPDIEEYVNEAKRIEREYRKLVEEIEPNLERLKRISEELKKKEE